MGNDRVGVRGVGGGRTEEGGVEREIGKERW